MAIRVDDVRSYRKYLWNEHEFVSLFSIFFVFFYLLVFYYLVDGQGFPLVVRAFSSFNDDGYVNGGGSVKRQ